MINSVRRLKASRYALQTLVVSICTVLVVRTFLNLFGYPQLLEFFHIQSSTLHISHVFFGGLFLYIGGVVNLFFHGKKVRQLSAVLLGIGLGLFIDEIGKFITQDYNYFYQPAAMLIYLAFIFLFAIYQYLNQSQSVKRPEQYYQVFEELEEVIAQDFEESEKLRLRQLLRKIPENSSSTYQVLYQNLDKLIRELPTKKNHSAGDWLSWFNKRINHAYNQLFSRPKLFRLLLVLFAGYGLGSLLEIIYYWLFKDFGLWDHWFASYRLPNLTYQQFFWASIQLASILVSAIMVLVGWIFFLRGNRLKGLRYFKNGLIIKIFLARPFSFYFDQFSASFGVLIDLFLLMGIEYLLDEGKLIFKVPKKKR